MGITLPQRKTKRPRGLPRKQWHNLDDFTETRSAHRHIAELEEGVHGNDAARARAHHSVSSYCRDIYIPHGPLRGYAVLHRPLRFAPTRASASLPDAPAHRLNRGFRRRHQTGLTHQNPQRLSLKTAKERRDTASRMRRALYDRAPGATSHSRTSLLASEQLTAGALRAQCVTAVPRNSDRANHMRWAKRWQTQRAETEGCADQLARRPPTPTIAPGLQYALRVCWSYG